MSFDWMSPSRNTKARSGEARSAQVRKELRERAAMYYRLRYSPKEATRRLRANVAWDYEVSGAQRPAWLTDAELGSIVEHTYKRRPAS